MACVGMSGTPCPDQRLSDPNYWGGWTLVAGNLGNAVGTWVNALDNNPNTPPVRWDPTLQQRQQFGLTWPWMLAIGAAILILLIFLIRR